MTPIEIAYLKHFMFDKAINQSFVSFYKKYRLQCNPESIEQFFLQTSVKDVFMKAFTFYPSNFLSKSNFSFDYWNDISKKWQTYMVQNEDNFSNESWPLLKKTFAILRQNWDLPHYYSGNNLESTEEVYERMHIELPLPEKVWGHGYCKKPVKKKQTIVDADFEDNDVSDCDLPDLDFFDGKDNLRNIKIRPLTISINRKKGGKITFSQQEYRMILDNGYLYARLGRDKQGCICIVLNKQQGLNLSNLNSERLRNISISSKDTVDKLLTLLFVKEEYSQHPISIEKKTPDYAIIKILDKNEHQD